MPFTTIARLADIPDRGALEVAVDGRIIALFAAKGSFHAIDGLCPHRLGPLGQGDLDGCIVLCPWHAWRFDVTTGRNPDMPAARVRAYPTRLVGDEIQIEIEIQP